MANTDYTDKQHDEHLATLRRTRRFPENSVFDPKAPNGKVFRKATPEEIKAVGVTPEPAKEGDE
jgi:hypothetical protein